MPAIYDRDLLTRLHIRVVSLIATCANNNRFINIVEWILSTVFNTLGAFYNIIVYYCFYFYCFFVWTNRLSTRS